MTGAGPSLLQAAPRSDGRTGAHCSAARVRTQYHESLQNVSSVMRSGAELIRKSSNNSGTLYQIENYVGLRIESTCPSPFVPLFPASSRWRPGMNAVPDSSRAHPPSWVFPQSLSGFTKWRQSSRINIFRIWIGRSGLRRSVWITGLQHYRNLQFFWPGDRIIVAATRHFSLNQFS